MALTVCTLGMAIPIEEGIKSIRLSRRNTLYLGPDEVCLQVEAEADGTFVKMLEALDLHDQSTAVLIDWPDLGKFGLYNSEWRLVDRVYTADKGGAILVCYEFILMA